MKRIDLGDINFGKLKKIDCECHLEAILYNDNNKAYKIYYKFPKYKLERKERKIELLHNGVILPHVVMPIDKLSQGQKFKGYTMKYISDSIPLYNIKERSCDYKRLFQVLTIISKTLRTIHRDPRNILVGDLNSHNIILDRSFNPYFIDFDSCKIDGLDNETIPAILGAYIENRNIQTFKTNKNSDKLSLLLLTLDTIFEKDIDDIRMYEYDKKAEQIKTLKNIRSLVLDMRKTKKIPTVPYLDELIITSDTQSKIRKKNII